MTSRRWIFAAALSLSLVAFDAGGADHYDGDETAGDPTGDIADFYAFPDGDKLALVMNVHPRAGKVAYFSDVIEYGFRIRSGELTKVSDGVLHNVGADEYRVVCNFSIVDEDARDLEMTARCGLSHGGEILESTEVRVDDRSGGTNDALRVYAGLRSDPFFTDAVRIRLPRPRYDSLSSLISTGNAMEADRLSVGVIAGGPDSTQGELPNVLSLVVQVDPSLIDVGDQLAIVAETNRRIKETR